MAKVEKLVLRSKTLKVIVSEEFTRAVIEAAAHLTIHSVQIQSQADQPSVQAMRVSIMPAYQYLATALSLFLNEKDITADSLAGLEVRMLPCLGTYTVAVNYKRPDGKIQPYAIRVSAPDSKNVFLRVKDSLGVEKAIEFMSEV